jgi:hypothetical protein
MKPESDPPSNLMQGVAKADCVRVWFSAKKVNTTKSPTAALMVQGV